MASDDPADTIHFSFKVNAGGGEDLGVFTACEGLGCEVAIEQREEGGGNGFIYQLPGRIKYGNVKLTRPINRDSAKVARWFSRIGDHKKDERPTATIVALTPEGEPIVSWTLLDVLPVKWQGPGFNVDGPKVATESIEFAHHGFSVDS